MQQAVCFRRIKPNKNKIPPHSKHTTNPQQPGDRGQLETVCDETRPTRWPILARFLHRSRVCGNRPRTAHAVRKNHECLHMDWLKTQIFVHGRIPSLNNEASIRACGRIPRQKHGASFHAVDEYPVRNVGQVFVRERIAPIRLSLIHISSPRDS